MPLILCIETSSKNCSIALSKNGSLVALKEYFDENYCHGEKLHVLISEVLSLERILIKDIDAFSLSYGPGSYTGLRIGASAVKGFGFSLNKPVMVMSTLKSLAHSYIESKHFDSKTDFLCPIIDSRVGEVYAATYDKNLNQINSSHSCVVSQHTFNNFLCQGKVAFFGTGLIKLNDIMKHENANFLKEDLLPSAASLVKISYQKFLKKDFVDTAYFEPLYLKRFIPTKSKNNKFKF